MPILNWSGRAELGSGTRLVLETRVVPFGFARTRSYVEGHDPEGGLILMVDDRAASVLRDDLATPLPARQAAHERAQFGLYGYLLERIRLGADDPRTHFERPGYPPIDFSLEAGRPTGAHYAVPDYLRDGTIDQRATFEGAIADKGIAWPRVVTLFREDRLDFRLTIDTFSVELD